jgi:S1-C subfamily serine protease
VGNAGGTGVLHTKTGKLTALRQAITVGDDSGGSSRLTGLIETSAPLRPGDSGGPLLSHGRVIGVDAAASSNLSYPSGGVGYAIPIHTAARIVTQIDAARRSAVVHVGPTAFLGVALGRTGYYPQDVPGAFVRDVVPGSPADEAGIVPGDVVTSLGATRISGATQLRNAMLRLSPRRTVRVAWYDQLAGATSANVRLVPGPPQ